MERKHRTSNEIAANKTKFRTSLFLFLQGISLFYSQKMAHKSKVRFWLIILALTASSDLILLQINMQLPQQLSTTYGANNNWHWALRKNFQTINQPQQDQTRESTCHLRSTLRKCLLNVAWLNLIPTLFRPTNIGRNSVLPEDVIERRWEHNVRQGRASPDWLYALTNVVCFTHSVKSIQTPPHQTRTYAYQHI